MVMPGGNIVMEIKLITIIETLKGLRFDIREGGRRLVPALLSA